MMIKHPFIATLFVASTIGLTACTSNTKNAYTDYQQANRTVKGTAVGAGTGAGVIGATAATAGAAATTAGVGAVVGSIVGYHWDKKEVALRDELRGTGIRVVDVDDGKNDIKLVMPSNIQFKSGSAQLSPEFKKRLNAVAKVMDYYHLSIAEIPGYADSVGADRYNKKLSAARAQAVANYLASQGVAKNRLSTVAYGENKPLAKNNTAKGRQLNRAVEIILHQPPRV